MILSLLLAGMGTAATAQNINLPIIQTKYTADPAPYVHNDTVYLYTTHDEDGAEGFLMKDWLLYTSTDMVNWQDRGAVASLKDFKWFKGENGAWAEQVIERNGKWYMYCPIHGHGIGVLVADNPYGPFKDPIGKPLAWEGDWFDIDPTVWIDDDNQAYMYWGNPELKAVKLNEDMISYSDSIMHFPKIQDYQEGPWFWKRNGNYYLAYASTCCPEGIGYAMSKNPLGPWEYKGHIMNHTPRTRGNHPGIIDYKGKSYCFGLNYDIFRLKTGRHAEQRSVSAAEMTYNPDGTIQELPYFQDCKLEQIEWFNPYRQVEAETMAWGYGLKTQPKNEWAQKDRWNQVVTNVDEGKYILVKGVDFKKGASKFEVSASCHMFGGSIEIRLDGVNGQCIGKVDIKNTKDEYKTFSTQVKKVKGVHDLYFVFKGGDIQKQNLFFLDWWKFGIVKMRITPIEISLTILIHPDGRVDIVPTSIIEKRFAQRILERTGRRISHSYADSHSARQFRVRTDIPVILTITFDGLCCPGTVVCPRKRTEVERRTMVCPVHHILGGIHTPFVHPEEVSLIFIMTGIYIETVSDNQRCWVGS